MNHINCISIDDEPMALEVIADYIKEVHFLNDLGSFTNTSLALDFLSSNDIDLVFLDIQMPDMHGMSFIEKLNEKKMIIFTTAYDKYALQSYDYNAVDYLLKPIEFERFVKATKKASKIYEAYSNENKTISIKSGHTLLKVNPREILYVEGSGNYLNFQTRKRKILSLMKMEEALVILPGYFIRIHKSFIVNTKVINRKSANQVLIENRTIPVSRTYKRSFKSFTL